MPSLPKQSLIFLLVAVAATRAFADFKSPLDEASAVQKQLRSVVETNSLSVYAVTAFAAAPNDSVFYASRLTGSTFAALADPRDRSCGSAFAIDATGHLLTNEHVVSGAKSVWVTDDSGHVFPAIVVGTDPRTDLAVLAIPSSTRAMPMTDAIPHRGDLVATLGNPDGLATDGNISASVGCVSAAGRSLTALSARENRSYVDLIQVTTPIAVGGSGGPLVDLAGNAIGIVCAVATADRDGMPVGFAITLSSETRGRIAQLIRGEEIVHPYFGVSVSAVTPKPDEIISLGARVDRVEAFAPAEGVLREGDIVVSMAGEAVTTDRRFIDLAARCLIDADVPLTVRRNAALVDLVLRPGRRPSPALPVTAVTQRLTWAGVTFENVEGGVRVSAVDSGKRALPLSVGTVIRRIDSVDASDVTALLRVLNEHVGEALTIEGDGEAR